MKVPVKREPQQDGNNKTITEKTQGMGRVSWPRILAWIWNSDPDFIRLSTFILPTVCLALGAECPVSAVQDLCIIVKILTAGTAKEDPLSLLPCEPLSSELIQMMMKNINGIQVFRDTFCWANKRICDWPDGRRTNGSNPFWFGLAFVLKAPRSFPSFDLWLGPAPGVHKSTRRKVPD